MSFVLNTLTFILFEVTIKKMFTFKLIALIKNLNSLKIFCFNKKKITAKNNSEVDIIDINFSKEKQKTLGKNKWLYPADGLVEKWKKPKIYKSKTFEL